MKIGIVTVLTSLLLLAGSTLAGDRSWSLFGGEKGSGNVVTETRDVDEFSRIECSGAFDVHVTVGEEQSVTLTFDDNLMDNIETRVRRGTLVLDSRGSYRSRHNCRVVISVRSLEEISSSGSGNMIVEGVRGETFECTVSGSGSMEISGEVARVEATVSGSGDIDLRDLKAEDASAAVSGSGDIAIFASERFEGSVSGSGDISYYGNPSQTRIREHGSGSVRGKG